MYLFCISCKEIVATIKVPNLVELFLKLTDRSTLCIIVNFHFPMQPEISLYILQPNIDFRPRILHPFSEQNTLFIL